MAHVYARPPVCCKQKKRFWILLRMILQPRYSEKITSGEETMKECIGFLFLLMCGLTYSAPSKDSSFVVSSAGPSKENGKERSSENPLPFPVIYEMDISSNISNRFAKTLVLSKVKNSQNAAKETTFTVVLPEKAFISEFVMEIDGKSYKAYVKEKEEARRDYDRALASGQSAGHVAVSARDSNKFTVSINVEPEAKATFLLTYEELLERKNEQYELVLNINPGQIVKRLNLEVHINESRPLRFVTTPSLRSGNEISKNEEKLDPSSDIQIINTTTAIVKFSPDSDRQKEFAKDLGGKESEGLSGQFVVQYDVERDPNGGEVLLEDGYFIHFFAPSNLDPLPKHVLFVLDTSGSMGGTKITQLKEAMKSILDEIKTGDIINIIEFDSEVNIWDIDNKNKTNVALSSHYDNPFSVLSEQNLPEPVSVTNETIYNAKNIIDELAAYGGTNIIAGLESALYLVKVGQESKSASTDKRFQPLIIFLTDGDPNVGIGSTEEIVRLTCKLLALEHPPVFGPRLATKSPQRPETQNKSAHFQERLKLSLVPSHIRSLPIQATIDIAPSRSTNALVRLIHPYDLKPVSDNGSVDPIVTKLNTENHKIPIFSLSFGNGADKGFLRKLSGKNQGFSRHIYEASDSSLQLQDFYKQISSPLLSNVNFKYESGVDNVTDTKFPIYFKGSELVVAGRYVGDSFPSSVNCWGPNGPINLRPTIRKPVTSLERLWAYLTVKQTLAKRDSVENKTELTKKSSRLSPEIFICY
ncbi:hypothetical protein NQ317_005461 [Molorchus minor]|uniref:Inter-alpha-trypsin inhibitor heavy chain H4-like n=1 Tax=Molorchus minor TaxID=1323400 RepID=A0ABQ9IU77_9CUCU|nr:hypothetical protein NQ317_005461 [Molorchus minor]